jgi:hypothetical protein
MSRLRILLAALAALGGLGLWLALPAALPAQGLKIKGVVGQRLPAKERAQIVKAVVEHKKVAPLFKGHRIEPIEVRLGEPDKDAPVKGPVATVVIFDYHQGKAHRFRLAVATGALVHREELSGQPQPSAAEIAAAEKIVRDDKDHAKLLKMGAILEGGFIADPPKGTLKATKVPHRIVQLHLLTKDRMKFERIIYVDLTDRKIISSRAE